MSKKQNTFKLNPEVLRITPRPTIQQYHESIMHDIMVRNPFPPDAIEMAQALAASVREHAEAETLLIRARAEARLSQEYTKIGKAVTEQMASNPEKFWEMHKSLVGENNENPNSK